MTQKTLKDVLSPPPENTGNLRWQAAVPLATNPFLLIELLQFAIIGGAIVLVTLNVGLWFTESALSVEDILNSLNISLLVVLGVVGAFLAISILFFGNRYFATCQMDYSGIYQESARGSDEGPPWCLRMRPFPVVGAVIAARTRSRHLIWEKVDRFKDIPSMRIILLKRGFWHMARLYTPDAQTHEQAVLFLSKRLKR